MLAPSGQQVLSAFKSRADYVVSDVLANGSSVRSVVSLEAFDAGNAMARWVVLFCCAVCCALCCIVSLLSTSVNQAFPGSSSNSRGSALPHFCVVVSHPHNTTQTHQVSDIRAIALYPEEADRNMSALSTDTAWRFLVDNAGKNFNDAYVSVQARNIRIRR